MTNTAFRSNNSRQRFTTVEYRSLEPRVPEWRLQAGIISAFHKLEAAGWPFTCAGDQNAERRGIGAQVKAKVTGMTAGEPDIRCYLPNGRIGLIELKAKDGRVSPEQRDRHRRLKELGHDVITIVATTVEDAVGHATVLLKAWLGRK